MYQINKHYYISQFTDTYIKAMISHVISYKWLMILQTYDYDDTDYKKKHISIDVEFIV